MAKTKRKAISKRARFEIFKRDGFICQYCGGHPPRCVLQVDHIIPVAAGGTNDDTNLVTACDVCNAGKSDVSLQVVPQSLADKAALIKEREDQLKGYTSIAEGKRKRLDDQARQVARVFADHFKSDSILKDYLQSIRKFVDELGVTACIENMEIATARKGWSENTCFRYFCGICWNIIKGGR